LFQLVGSATGTKVNPKDVAQAILDKLPQTDFCEKVFLS
jgi:hypothetical protein